MNPEVSHGRCPRRVATAEPCVFCGDYTLNCASSSYAPIKMSRGPSRTVWQVHTCVAVCDACFTDADQERCQIVATHLGLVEMTAP